MLSLFLHAAVAFGPSGSSRRATAQSATSQQQDASALLGLDVVDPRITEHVRAKGYEPIWGFRPCGADELWAGAFEYGVVAAGVGEELYRHTTEGYVPRGFEAPNGPHLVVMVFADAVEAVSLPFLEGLKDMQASLRDKLYKEGDSDTPVQGGVIILPALKDSNRS